jgi:hypothetical protein
MLHQPLGVREFMWSLRIEELLLCSVYTRNNAAQQCLLRATKAAMCIVACTLRARASQAAKRRRLPCMAAIACSTCMVPAPPSPRDQHPSHTLCEGWYAAARSPQRVTKCTTCFHTACRRCRRAECLCYSRRRRQLRRSVAAAPSLFPEGIHGSLWQGAATDGGDVYVCWSQARDGQTLSRRLAKV